MSEEKQYIKSKDFKEQLKKYYETDILTDELALNIIKIAENLSYNWRFIKYTPSWKEEMIGDAIVKMYTALEKKLFKIDSDYNPFSYFNQIAWHAFSNRIKKEKKQHDGLQEYKDFVYENEMIENSGGTVYIKPHIENDEFDEIYD